MTNITNLPLGVIFDMDGVLVDESQSYRASVQKTVKWFSGKDITPECIAEYKAGGGLNNDWDCTEAILTDLGKNVSREEMIKEFQRFYLGSKEDNSDGLIAKEEWLLDKDLLNELSQGFALGIVTGRPRDEALIALQTAGTEQFFSVLLAMEDCEGEKKKPNPYGVLKCLKKLDCDYGYYIGDTGDDMIAAKNSSVVGIGVLPPQDKSDKLRELLIEKGAKKVIASVNDIKEVL